MRKLLIITGAILCVFCISWFSYNMGHKIGGSNAYSKGYAKGQVDLTIDLVNQIGETVNSDSISDDYIHFTDIQDITLYIYDKNGVKTLAEWK